jgi:hypothetical protein
MQLQPDNPTNRRRMNGMMFSVRCGLLTALACVSLVVAGCSDSMSGDEIALASSSFDKALELEQSGSHGEALVEVEKAITGGGLTPDQLGEAYLLRARAKANTGDVPGAEADLATSEQGSPDLAIFHWTRSVILDKQGKASEAKSAMALARKNDPTNRLPK